MTELPSITIANHTYRISNINKTRLELYIASVSRGIGEDISSELQIRIDELIESMSIKPGDTIKTSHISKIILTIGELDQITEEFPEFDRATIQYKQLARHRDSTYLAVIVISMALAIICLSSIVMQLFLTVYPNDSYWNSFFQRYTSSDLLISSLLVVLLICFIIFCLRFARIFLKRIK